MYMNTGRPDLSYCPIAGNMIKQIKSCDTGGEQGYNYSLMGTQILPIP